MSVWQLISARMISARGFNRGLLTLGRRRAYSRDPADNRASPLYALDTLEPRLLWSAATVNTLASFNETAVPNPSAGLIMDSAVSPAGATFVKTDSTTQGAWQTNYGADGYDISQGPSSLPGYATMTLSGQNNWTWPLNNNDARDLALPNGGGTLPGTWYSSTSFTIDLNMTDGQSHQVSFYLLDWDDRGRREQVQVINADTGLVLDTQTASNFSRGEYLDWNLSGHVKLVFTNLTRVNAVLSGIFFGGAQATFLGTDTTTQGHWAAAGYGSQGYDISQGPASFPSYATVAFSGQSNFTWARNNGDARNLDLPSSGTLAATWYSSTSFTLDLNFTDGNSHNVAFYFLDWDRRNRQEQVQVTDAATGLALNTQTVSNFYKGEYLSWNLSGHVKLVVTNTAGPNAVLSGVFFN